jgi:lipopolysaccharide biosynthesis regulator YciM
VTLNLGAGREAAYSRLEGLLRDLAGQKEEQDFPCRADNCRYCGFCWFCPVCEKET